MNVLGVITGFLMIVREVYADHSHLTDEETIEQLVQTCTQSFNKMCPTRDKDCCWKVEYQADIACIRISKMHGAVEHGFVLYDMSRHPRCVVPSSVSDDPDLQRMYHILCSAALAE